MPEGIHHSPPRNDVLHDGTFQMPILINKVSDIVKILDDMMLTSFYIELGANVR